MQLLLGSGRSRIKRVICNGSHEWEDLVTVDIDPSCKPDLVWDLTSAVPLPFADGSCSEIHAYHVLEHLGRQGDYRTFFAQFEDYWRMLEDGGLFFGVVPLEDAGQSAIPFSRPTYGLWGDPGHGRVINRMTLTFLNQAAYAECGTTTRTDYRWCYKGDFVTREEWMAEDFAAGEFRFMLAARKGATA